EVRQRRCRDGARRGSGGDREPCPRDARWATRSALGLRSKPQAARFQSGQRRRSDGCQLACLRLREYPRRRQERKNLKTFPGQPDHQSGQRERNMAKVTKVSVGEALVGDGNEVAHIDLIIGPRGSAAETAFCHTLTSQREGVNGLLAVIGPNLMCKP